MQNLPVPLGPQPYLNKDMRGADRLIGRCCDLHPAALCQCPSFPPQLGVWRALLYSPEELWSVSADYKGQSSLPWQKS